jgi:hypothetical protein
MNPMNALTTLALCLTFVSGEAFARKSSSREGFNFGLSVLTTADNSKLYPSKVSEKTREVSNSVEGYSPFMGYSFDTFSLGLKFGQYSESLSTTERSSLDPSKVNRLSSMTAMRHASLFGRLNFGGYFFLELGAGLYKEAVTINNEYVSELGDGIFEGKTEHYNLTGTGSGSHFGGGFEVPMSKTGFFLTGEYIRQTYVIKEASTAITVGAKQSSRVRNALNLGLAYYFN